MSDPTPPADAQTDVIVFGAQETAGEEGNALYLIHPDGSGVEKLADEPAAVSFPRWSPASDRVAYFVGAGDGGGTATIRVYDFAAGTSTTVTDRALASAFRPALGWSSDGNRLVFAEAPDSRLRVYDLERREYLERPDVTGDAPDWAARDDEIAFVLSSPAAPDGDLFALEPDGGRPEALLERPGPQGDPRWSPTGRMLAFWSAAEGQTEKHLLVLDTESGDTTDLGPGYAAAWSHDGEQIAYTRAPGPDDPANLDIYVVPAGGGESRRLTSAVSLDSWPSWAPAGDRIAYVARVDARTSFLCLFQLDPGGDDCLDLGGLVPGAPAWSPR